MASHSSNSQSDDLDINPFYRCLQTVFRSKFSEAQNKCWIVCIPQTISIKYHKITGQFIDCHIFKPSPYFKSQFVSTDKGESKAIEIEGNFIKLITSGNFNEFEVKILSEELSYNQDYQPFKMYILEKPLDPSFQNKNDSQEQKVRSGKPKITVQECRSFLLSFPCHSSIIKDLDKKIYLFNKNYIILPAYLHDAAERLKDMIHWATQELIDSHQGISCHESADSEIKVAVENYVLGHVHSKLFSVIREKCAKADMFVADRLQELYNLGLTPDQLGVQLSFCCPLSTSVVELASLNSKSSPSEKLQCLKTTLELIPQDIYNAFKETESPFNKLNDVPNLASDDLIPLLVTVLVQARPQHLESNLYYMQNFSWSISSRDKQSFSLVTFQAAKEFLKSHDFSHLKPSNNKIKKEMTLEELMEVTVKIQKQSREKEFGPSGRTTSPIDRHLHRITKMIEDSTRELRDQEEEQVATKTALQNTSQERLLRQSSGESLGDFLSSLQQNCLGVSYGKQA